MATKYEIDIWVQNAANSIRRFYPFAVSNALGLPLSLVLDRLNYLVKDGALILKYEIRCDDGDVIDLVHDYREYLGKNLYCKFCDEDIEIGVENIYPVYFFGEEYRQSLKKKEHKTTDIQQQEGSNSALGLGDVAKNILNDKSIGSSHNSKSEEDVKQLISILSEMPVGVKEMFADL